MKNCLVTKLKGSVNNDSLPKVGELKIHFGKVETPTVDTNAIIVRAVGGAVTLRVANGYFTDSAFTQNLGDTHIVADLSADTVYISNTEADLFISNKYDFVEQIKFAGSGWYRDNIAVNLEDLSYMSGLRTLWLRGCNVQGSINDMEETVNIGNVDLINCTDVYGSLDQLFNDIDVAALEIKVNGHFTLNFNNLQKTNVRGITVNASDKIEGALSALASHSSHSATSFPIGLTLVSNDATGVTGTLSDLISYYGVNPASADNLNCSIARCINVTGSIESLADGLVAKGKVSGKLTLALNALKQTGITVNGSAITNNSYVVTFTNSGYTIA